MFLWWKQQVILTWILMSHLVHLPICPIADNLDQLKDPCWILQEKQTDSWSLTIFRQSSIHASVKLKLYIKSTKTNPYRFYCVQWIQFKQNIAIPYSHTNHLNLIFQATHSPTHCPPTRLNMEENRQAHTVNIDTRLKMQEWIVTTWTWLPVFFLICSL